MLTFSESFELIVRKSFILIQLSTFVTGYQMNKFLQIHAAFRILFYF